ncbi:MAG: Rpn family recombination-promoting nuclease/putative transposase [Turicibacter sp.]|nr:Rpn family recombination-promoting nuclease/putative transposase [Turicibacter sp.]
MLKDREWLDKLDFSQLMDLRVDYAFKLLFATGETFLLISLLNAIFASAGIARTVKSLAILSPQLERQSEEDKLSILDVRAVLDDGSEVLIEMHLYDTEELKYKTIHSWARIYNGGVKKGEDYSKQAPVICVSFMAKAVDASEPNKIHKCCKIADIESREIFTDALELHYINMKAFINAVNKANMSKLEKWLAVLTEKDIADKAMIKGICGQEEDIAMAIATLEKLSMDRYAREAYEKRQQEIEQYFLLVDRKNKQIAEQAKALAKQEKALAKQEKIIAEKDFAMLNMAKTIEEYKAKFGEIAQ